MKPTDVRKKSPDELKKLLNELSEELREFRFAMSSGQRNNVRRARTLRTDIARIKTVLNEQK
ncbi:MAG: 50S ribosomal protein L29 [Patescibacteria group bacterium UBA2163]